MRAADARVILVMKLVVGHVVVVDVAPDLLRSPVDDWIDLHQTKFGIPFNSARTGPNRCLVAANACDPCAQLSELAAQRLHFSEAAAEVGITRPKRRPVGALLLVGREH